ncbi:sas10/utp3 family protein [Colletotrichum tofieldiae]|uniref:Sas10/Utp3 family protein n=1 Tax=Colletotrichum tofieldiae TaxID=708197 RepID=A0A166Y3J4_9PEZI|nr:Sas10/Utp3 family protein [Colletotrichum tofieldiae]GKT53926.1 Sas10/Utp3 family protein [Colletotrichum tofieldiae]GKT73663.1 sas10/utp3 family protein [Colletotrichum tofieldiae]
MAKKRKASAQNARTGPKELDPADARLGPITTYEDVADSEEEYFLNRDKIMFDEGPKSKRRKRAEEEDKFLDNSEEEILDLDDGDDSDDEDTRKAPRKSKKAKAGADSEEEGEGEEDEADPSWWGSSKKEYYDADQIETEADALEEEAEAKRLQQKKLAKMSEEDFLFDEGEWLATKPDEAEDQEVVTEVLKDIEVTDDMGPEERIKILQNRYPEFEHLVNEFQELQPQLNVLQKEAHGKSSQSLEAVKYWILGCYVAALASYFAILTSPARDDASTQKTLDPAELRDHDVMETLLECREAWQQVKSAMPVQPDDSMDVSSAEEEPSAVDDVDEAAFAAAKEELKRQRKLDKAAKAKNKQAQKQAQAIEESLADLDDLLKQSKKSSKKKKAAAKAAEDGDNSDFGEEEVLDARTAADKAARKKSLRFYTSQIVQKANKRADAGRDAGGDVDIPYRERLRDRQARLNREAERRGQKFGADLGDDDGSDGDDSRTAAGVREDGDDEYYDMVAASSKKKKAEKAALYDALAAASKADRVVEQEVVGEDGKRKITYAIEKNKGLTPKRKKEVRNPRVKKRMKYEEKQKKLKSMKPVWQGGEPKGGYGGELSGITTGIVRARKL